MARMMLAALGAVGLSLLPSAALAAPGEDYYLIGGDLEPIEAPITVVEFFNFSCPACNRMQPELEKWLEEKPDYVEFSRSPVPFDRWGGLYAKAFFVLEAFGRQDLQDDFYRAIHSERKLLNSEDRIAGWMAGEGIDEERAAKAFSSFAVSAKLRRAERLVDANDIDSTPQLVVSGRYRLTPVLSRSYYQMLATADRIIAALRRGETPK